MIEIRPCTSGDAPAISALLGELGYEVSSGGAAERVQHLNTTGSDPTLIAYENGVFLGLIALHLCRMIQYEKPVMRITALVVGHQARRRGIGRLLIREALRCAKQAECELVELTSALDRTAAHAFYRNMGFEANSMRFRKSLVPRV